ncbi:FAD-dependent oxidoreductase [Ramlibacter rhizophilus]|uniref:Pyridine nucleotide-disulfide oxidoreductase n=1 Tax=Ramlibacter rhizophilus TaxID=1781167 RepID=A0A4Z0BQK2_9BURK|nr:bifunctional TVP38/TMEM64 family protein/FAD-dependent oxidoreductase [Ramlibacter rhizophilus]TFZ01052.1 pyridine nucleotide-disulfide oxidoreductase [Ramlibacter rhizophilus]
MRRSKLVLVLLLLAAIVLFFSLDAGRYLSLDALRSAQAGLQAQVAARPLASAGLYFLLYVAVTGLSLPGAALLTLAGGALFGLLWGTLIVSFASSLGALLAFLIARFLLQDAVQARFGRRLGEIDAGLQRDGALYLFTLRLVPLVPFFLVNLLMGLTRMRALTFYAVSQLGMLPGTLVYVNAGTQLASVESLGGLLSVRVLGAFVLLAIFPWLARAGLAAWRRRRVYARWRGRKPRRFDRNLVVIGAGAAGLVSAYLAAALKAKVTLVESHKMGGDCLNYGCVPSKTLIRSARLAHQMRHAGHWGGEAVAPTFSFARVMARVREVIRAIEPHDSVARYTGLGADVVAGHARLLDPWTVEITPSDGGPVRRLATRSVVIAAGAQPLVPPLPGLKEVGFLTSDTMWEAFERLDAPPRRLAILGGGPIGCELAQALARLGSQVTQVEMAPRLLLREDDEVSALVRTALEADGVQVLTGHEALRCERQGDEKRLWVRGAAGERAIEFDALVCAVGRRARLAGYGLEELGIPAERTVQANEYLETLYPNIYAAGDVAGPWQFTHTAAHQAWYATVNALFGSLRRFKVDARVIPAVTFTDPEVARVGLNEREAREQGVPFEVTRYALGELDRAIAEGETQGFVKVLTVPGKDRILGATVVGAHAGELLAEWVLAMKHGLGLNKVLGTLHAYPTFAEANKYAAGEWRRAHQPAWALRLLQRWHAWRL